MPSWPPAFLRTVFIVLFDWRSVSASRFSFVWSVLGISKIAMLPMMSCALLRKASSVGKTELRCFGASLRRIKKSHSYAMFRIMCPIHPSRCLKNISASIIPPGSIQHYLLFMAW